MSRAPLYAALAGGLIAACATTDPASEGSFGTEVDGCRACQTLLVECTSTSENEAQFVECRDQWLGCQRGKGIGRNECRNPRDQLACDLCRDRLQKCNSGGDAEACETQFSVCKAFLITRGDVADRCSADGSVPPQVACPVCQKDYAKCVSDASGTNTPSTCSSKLGECLTSHGLDNTTCPVPGGTAACEICDEVRDGCAATGATDCEADYGACTQTLAPSITCETTTTSSGAGGSTAACTHSACEYGPALEDGCNSCVTTVCDEDSYCCNQTAGTWDTFCLDIAAGIAECGCEGTAPEVCAHSPCEYGDALQDGCNACVSAVCGQDPWCCSGKWDNYCIDAAQLEPSCSCTISI